MKNKKVVLLILLAFCAMQFFAVESERIIKKLPAGVNEKSVCAFHMWGENQFDFIYKAGDKYFINLCGKKIGPFKYRPGLFHPRENFAYTFRDENENVHLVLDGKELGTYEGFYFFIFMSEQENTFTLRKKDGGWYIITEKEFYGPFEDKQDFALRK